MNKLFLLCSLLSMSIYSQTIDNLRRIEVNGFFTNPVFSPTGEHVLLTGEHLKGVYLLRLEDNAVKQISDKEGSGYAYSWDETGKAFYFKEKPDGGFFSDSNVMRYNIEDESLLRVENIDHNYLPSYTGKDGNNVVVYTNTATLGIEAKDLASSKRWNVTNDDNQYYNAVLSHDGKKVAVHTGADIIVYTVDGSSAGIKAGTGIATGWTPDDKYLIGFLDESEDGHTVTNSEIYFFNVETGRSKKVTNTEVISEMFPTVHDDKIIFADDKTGRIYIATLK